MDHIPFWHPAWIEINLAQFKQNLQVIRRFVGDCRLCLPVKANAYGHGLVAIARAAVEARVDYLAVSCLQEGVLLREAGIDRPILVLGAIHENQIGELIRQDLEFTLSSRYKAELAARKSAELQRSCRVHVEVDTGMQRTGVRPETAVELLDYLYGAGCFQVVGVYSHLATADDPHSEFARVQIAAFRGFIQDWVLKAGRRPLIHLANSGGVCNFPESHLDMVRPGLLAFGYFPGATDPRLAGIAPFFAVKAKISYFKVVGPGQGIGYGHTHTTRRETRIVTIPVGYGDGFRRALSNRGSVLIRGRRYPIVGNVCMDQCMVDIGQDEAYVGDEVTLVGRDGAEEVSLGEMAELCDTIPYEILCGFNDRLPRIYLP
ncbi:MAG: alanine racemase [Holophaga sp.]|nr:alanine racemase [Holophaga sp.]